MRQRVGIPATPVASQTHSVIDIGESSLFPAGRGLAARATPQLHGGIVLAQPLPGARERRENLRAWRIGDHRILVQMLERRREVVSRLAVGVLLDRGTPRGV